MHDLKGHLSKVLPDLTKVIQNTTLKTEIAHYLMNFFKKPNLYGSDFREATIQILHIIAKSGLDQGDPLFVFIATIVKISEIVYSRENKRTPRQCLQFYNCAFLHQELYHELFALETSNSNSENSWGCFPPHSNYLEVFLRFRRIFTEVITFGEALTHKF